MSSVKFSLNEDVLLALVFLIRQLESERIKLQAALNDSDEHISLLEDKCRSLKDKYEQMLDQKVADMYELHQKIAQEESKVRWANEDLAEAIIYNSQLEVDNGELQHEIHALNDRLFEAQLTGH